ncbi:MAG: class I SAM-dependent methyltransferase [Anaerolineales bacterium]|nr:class I SAM-dependent methyltransferase [Anaerolineales bacterium]
MRTWLKNLNMRLFFRLFYLRRPPWDTGITPPELQEFIASHPPGRALDLGCGTGTNAINLAKEGWEVTGVDFVPSAIRQARKKAHRAGVEVSFLVGDVSDARNFNHTYDLILDIGCYHTVPHEKRPDYRQLVSEHLGPQGTYLLYSHLGEADNWMTEKEVSAFQRVLNLKRRVDSTDRNQQPSAWFWFGPQSETG